MLCEAVLRQQCVELNANMLACLPASLSYSIVKRVGMLALVIKTDKEMFDLMVALEEK